MGALNEAFDTGNYLVHKSKGVITLIEKGRERQSPDKELQTNNTFKCRLQDFV